jgi:hypothetical protein
LEGEKMSDLSPEQKKAHDFLLNKFSTQERFTKEEFKRATGWVKASTFDTYWTKQFLTLLVPLEDDKYRVSEVFRRFTALDKFQSHVTQKRRVASDYTTFTFDKVMLFEFFMPLTNEGYLRTSLDALFYKDTIISRLKSCNIDELKEQFPKNDEESKEEYFDRICEWVSGKFVGYSISHVNGRFRAGDLKSIKEAYESLSIRSGRYLVDETTAIVRFIFPCSNDSEIEMKQISYFFKLLFVQSIVEAVNGEDEIWLLESGYQNKLHIWRVQND